MSASAPPTAIAASLTVDQLRHIVRKEIDAALATRAPVEGLLTTAEMAAVLKIHPKTLARRVRLEGLPAHRTGDGAGEYRFKMSEVDAWLAARRSSEAG
jgi:excisionase family DNA binding protein